MRIAIIGSALSGNKGAAAMLESSVQQLTARDPKTRFVLLSMYPRSDAEQNTYPQMTVLDASPLRLGVVINGAALLYRLIPPLRSAIAQEVPQVGAIAEADVLLDEGGVTFVDGRGKFLVYNIASILPALLVGTPVVKVAQAMGPFREFLNRTAARLFLPRMAAIVSRGAVTHENLLGLGLTNVTPGADLAFTLEITEQDVERARRAVDTSFFNRGDVVGIAPSAVLRKGAAARGEDYPAEVVRLIDHITGDLGRPVLLVAHSARAHTDKTHNNDLPLCRDVYARVASPDKVLFPDGELSPQTLRYLIGRCDVFIASRFHAMISSLAMEVPTLVIGWSHKYREVLDMLGLADWAVPHGSVEEVAIFEKLDDLLRARHGVHQILVERLPAVRAAALAQLDVIGHVAGC